MDLDTNSSLNIEGLAAQFKDPITPREENDIMVIGVGGGGGNAVNHMFRQGADKVTFVVLNTDAIAVNSSPVPNKVVIGNGRGAGNNPEVARQFAEDDIDKIYSIFDSSAKMVFITAGMGGGTGTGAAPVVARVAKERGLLTIGIVTIPFVFEGIKKIEKALDGADEIAKYVDALLIINNERLTEIHPDLNFFNAFGKADDTLSTAARSISEIITIEGYINLDFNDVDTTLRSGGTAIISTGYGEGEGRITKAIEDALNSPLLKNRDIYGSKHLLMNLYMSAEDENAVTMKEMDEFKKFVASIDKDVDVIWGAAVDNSLGNKVKLTILASGFDITIREEEDMLITPVEEPKPVRKPAPRETPAAPKSEQSEAKKNRVADLYGDKVTDMGNNYIVLTPEQMDDDSVMETLERYPAYNREKRIVDSVAKSAPTPGPDDPQGPSLKIEF